MWGCCSEKINCPRAIFNIIEISKDCPSIVLGKVIFLEQLASVRKSKILFQDYNEIR